MSSPHETYLKTKYPNLDEIRKVSSDVHTDISSKNTDRLSEIIRDQGLITDFDYSNPGEVRTRISNAQNETIAEHITIIPDLLKFKMTLNEPKIK